MIHPYKQGDEVEITYDGQTVDGVIRLISGNRKSGMIMFEGILGIGDGGYAGMMPIFLDEENMIYRDLIFKKHVGLRPKEVETKDVKG